MEKHAYRGQEGRCIYCGNWEYDYESHFSIRDIKNEAAKKASRVDLQVMPKFAYLRTPLNKFTFNAPKIKEWVESVAEGYTLNLFAGKTKLNINELRNDIREEMPADFHLDALEFCRTYKGRKFNTILLDPPYSLRKSMEMYDGKVMSPFNQLKDAIVNLVEDNGIVITFGYHSVSMGMKRNFKVDSILLMSHGGAIHDTIATLERKFTA